MIIIKLYILRLSSNDKVFAISEYKYHMRLFILQNEFSIKDYSLEKNTDKKKIDKYLLKYDDLYLSEFKDFIIRNIDLNNIEYILYSLKEEVYRTLEMLENINMSCIMSPKEHKEITKTIYILDKHSRKRTIDNFINTNEIIKNYFNNHYYRHSLQEMNDNYYYHLNNLK